MSEKIFIQEDGERREATDLESIQIRQDLAEMQTLETSIRVDKDSKIAARESALAKLAALGLTEEEIAAL
jgi:DNA-binding NarL/FixJ family response regulator